MPDSILDLGFNEDPFRIKNKEISSDTQAHIASVKRSAVSLREEILKGGSNEGIEKALDKLNEAVFWFNHTRTQ